MYNIQGQPMRRRSRWFRSAIILCVMGALFIFSWRPLAYLCLQSLFSRLFEKTPQHQLQYAQMRWEKGHLLVSHLDLKEADLALHIDKMELGVHFFVKNFPFSPFIKLTRPQLALAPSHVQTKAFIPFFLSEKFYIPQIEIDNGVLQLTQEKIYFGLHSKAQRQGSASFYMSFDPAHQLVPFFVADLEKRDNHWMLQADLQQIEAEKIVNLMPLFYPQFPQGWKDIHGFTQFKAHAILDDKMNFQEISCQLLLDQLALSNPDLKLHAAVGHFESDFHYPHVEKQQELPFWKQIQSTTALDHMSFALDQHWIFSDLKGSFSLDPNEDPALFLTGNLKNFGTLSSFHLQGKGSVHQDHSFWMEASLNLMDRVQKKCSLFCSVCRPEQEEFVVQAEFKNDSTEQLEVINQFLSDLYPKLSQFSIQSGVFHAKAIAWLKSSQLNQIELEHLSGEKVGIKVNENAEVLYLDHLKAQAKITAPFKDLSAEVNMTLSLPLTAPLIYFPESYRNLAVPSDCCLLNAQCKITKGHADVTGSIELGSAEQKPSVQFGLQSAFEDFLDPHIQEAWVHATHLTPIYYYPWVKELWQFELEGEADFFGVFDGSQVQLSIQMEQAHFKNHQIEGWIPQIGVKDPLLLKTLGRATLRYDLANHRTELHMPVQAGLFFDHSSHLVFKDFTGQLQMKDSVEGWEGEAHCQQSGLLLDDTALIQGASFHAQYNSKNQEIVCDHFKGAAVLDQAPLSLEMPSCIIKKEAAQLEAVLFNQGKKYALFKANYEKDKPWHLEGKFLDKNSFSGPCSVDLLFDLEQKATIFSIQSEHLHCFEESLKDLLIQGRVAHNHWVIQQLRFNEWSGHAAVKAEKTQWTFEQLALSYKQINLFGRGNMEIDWPELDHQVTFKATMDVGAELKDPGISLRTAQPVKIIYSPEAGLIMGNLDLISEKSQIKLEHLEYVSSSRQMYGRNGSFKIVPLEKSELKNLSLFPFSLMPIGNEAIFQGNFSCALEKNKLKLEGELAEEGSNQSFHFNAETFFPVMGSRGHCQLENVNENQKLDMDFILGEDFSLSWQEINGSLGKTSVELKYEESSEGLKGYKGKISAQASDASLLASYYLASIPLHYEELLLKGKFWVDAATDWKFNGAFCAKGLKWDDWRFEAVEGKIMTSTNGWILEEIKVQDPRAELMIPHITFTRTADWQFNIPTLEIKTLALQQLYPETLSERFKGWVIQKGALNHLNGQLQNKNSWSGNGVLSFSRDQSADKPLFEFNDEAFNVLGFHPSPMSGEIAFELKEGRCVFLQLKNVRGSEGKTEFLLPKTPFSCYLDLQGNLHLDFTLKQANNKRYAQLFNLSIRGTLENPELSVR